MGGAPKRRMNLQEDENFQDNVKFIKKTIGEDVKISTDFPPIHEETGLIIGDIKLLQDIDTALKLGMTVAVKDVRKTQKESSGFMSWSDLTHIFESENSEMFQPCTGDDKTRYKHDYQETGTYIKFDNFDGASDTNAMLKAEDVMKKCVGN